MQDGADRRSVYGLFSILLVGLFLRLLFFSGMTGYDEFHYAHIARNLTLGNFSLPDVSGYYGFRYLVTVPAAVFISIFGLNAAALSLWPLACSLGSIWVVFLLGRLLSGERAGLIAALLYACLPVSVIFGTMLYPDETVTFLVGLSVLFFLKGEKEGNGGGALFFMLAGLFCGLGYLARINALLILLFFAAYTAVNGWRTVRLAFLSGLALALLPEAAVNFVKTGDALFSWNAQQLRLAADTVNFSTSLLIYPRGMLGLDLYGLSLFGFFFHLFLICLGAYLLGHRPAGGGTLLLWFSCIFLYLEFGPSHLSWAGYAPAHKQLRFLSMAAMPAALFSALYLTEMKRIAAGCAVIFVIITSAYGAAKMSEYHALQAEPYRLAYGYLRTSDPAFVFVPDPDWRARLNFYYGSPLSAPYYPEGAGTAGGVRMLAALSGDNSPGMVWAIGSSGVASGICGRRKAQNEVQLGAGAMLYRCGPLKRGSSRTAELKGV